MEIRQEYCSKGGRVDNETEDPRDEFDHSSSFAGITEVLEEIGPGRAAVPMRCSRVTSAMGLEPPLGTVPLAQIQQASCAPSVPSVTGLHFLRKPCH